MCVKRFVRGLDEGIVCVIKEHFKTELCARKFHILYKTFKDLMSFGSVRFLDAFLHQHLEYFVRHHTGELP